MPKFENANFLWKNFDTGEKCVKFVYGNADHFNRRKLKIRAMRVRKCQCLLLCALLLNVVALYYFWRMQSSLDKYNLDIDDLSDDENGHLERKIVLNQHLFNQHNQMNTPPPPDESNLHSLVTVVIQEFESFDHDLQETVISILDNLPHVRLLIISDKRPYPPLILPNSKQVKMILLHQNPDRSFRASRPEYHVMTPFILFVPDSVRVSTSRQVERMVSTARLHPESVVVAKIAGEKFECCHLSVNLREWTISNQPVDERSNKFCNSVEGKQVLLVPTKSILNVTLPFARPFPHSLFIQGSLRKWKVYTMDNEVEFGSGKTLFTDPHLTWKFNANQDARLHHLYDKFGIKKVIHQSGKVQWYGCSKHTLRCFGTVLDDMPEYLFDKRWTPPCCLEALRKTTRHVLKLLKQQNIRHWLEGGSLLGAVRNGDVIPWDYDVDVGIYKDDIQNSPQLVRANEKPFEDENGFVWEKAKEGEFYRVHYSKSNRMHVDIFPFYSKKGVMTKSDWFKTHRQDMEFPETFLRPLTTINFVGIQASAPNNIRDFLELKFGEGVIEKPQYPNPSKLKFPNNSIYFNF